MFDVLELYVKFRFQVSKFSGRFKTIPDMLEADHLTVSGDVTFGKDVSLKVSSRMLKLGTYV